MWQLRFSAGIQEHLRIYVLLYNQGHRSRIRMIGVCMPFELGHRKTCVLAAKVVERTRCQLFQV